MLHTHALDTECILHMTMLLSYITCVRRRVLARIEENVKKLYRIRDKRYIG